MKKKAIILNHMFTGDFLNENIGHEVINLFVDDQGEHYIYLCKDGKFNREDVDIENSYVVQVFRPEKTVHTLQVLSVATGLTLKEKKTDPLYNQTNLSKIFANNVQKQDRYVTFHAKKVYEPTRPVYIKHGKRCHIKADVVLNHFSPSQQLREYLWEGTEDYKAMLGFLSQLNTSDSLWKMAEKVKVEEKEQHKEDPNGVNVTEIYGIQTRELSYSNAFKYFIEKYPELFIEFSKLEIAPSTSAEVYREWNNIDLLIDCGEYLTVVENKICSGLNGKEDDTNQLDKYKKIIEGAISKKQIEDTTNPFYKRKPCYIVLCPDHNHIKEENEQNYENDQSVSNSDHTSDDCVKAPWKIIRYSTVYKFLKEKMAHSPYNEDHYLKDFVYALKDHASEDYNREIMLRKFLKTVKKISEKNKQKNDNSKN